MNSGTSKLSASAPLISYKDLKFGWASAEQEGALDPGEDFDFAIDSLKKLGLLPSPSLKEMVLTSSSRTFKVKLPVVFESEFRRDRHEQNLKFPFFVEKLKTILINAHSPNRHILVIDGLDDILTSNTQQYQSLAGLVLEVSRLNTMFARSGRPIKVRLCARISGNRHFRLLS